jgi:magnesium-transporting ATPase (P-type)
MGQPVVGVTRVPRTFGILSIIFASIVLFSSLFGVIGLVVPVLLRHAPPGRPEERQALEMLSHMYLMMGAMSAILLVMSATLLALGIGQLRYRAWAAVWTIRWGIVAIGSIVVMAILVSQMFSGTLFSALAQNNPDAAAGAHQVGRMFGAVYAGMVVLFYSPYPIMLIAFFTRARVRAAMNA